MRCDADVDVEHGRRIDPCLDKRHELIVFHDGQSAVYASNFLFGQLTLTTTMNCGPFFQIGILVLIVFD